MMRFVGHLAQRKETQTTKCLPEDNFDLGNSLLSQLLEGVIYAPDDPITVPSRVPPLARIHYTKARSTIDVL